MKKNLAFSICFLLFILVSCSARSQSIKLQNEMFIKELIYSSTKADKIEFEVRSSKEILADSKNKPFFEFVINRQKVSSNDKLWIYKSISERKMGNGGMEYTLIFEGMKEPVVGLQVVLVQQIFPESTLMREKLELRADNYSFHLNKLNGKLHFIFPSYSIQMGKELLKSSEINIATWEKTPITFGDKKSGNHMFYPNIKESVISKEGQIVKGPISIVSNGKISWLTAYEHASQDNLKGLFDEQKLGSGNMVNDATQGTKGFFDFPIRDEDFRYLGISAKRDENNVNISVEILKGGYLDDEIIDKEHPYSTVWTATGFFKGDDLEVGKEIIRNYLFNQICEKPASRQPEYYYNTWGLQRQDKTKPLRGILTYDRIFEEIDYAAELGVDIFVLDDGWENAQGEWFPNTERLTEGLAPIKKRLDKYGIKMGLWYSPMGIDTVAQRYKEHQNWVIRDSKGKPILAQWNHPAFDFVGGFFDLFVADCKTMIDEGCRFMKWDAMNTFYSSLSGLNHGSDKYPEEEIRERYGYLFPIYVARAMEILTDYEPELVIEIDLTEAFRVMVGLAPLSQGKLFWMNNGASSYNDYTTFRTKSMRTIANEYAGIIPLELLTYANYPQNITGNMKYNVNNSLLAGHGFWGNLALMSKEERKWVGSQVRQSKKVLPYLVNINPKVVGKVGDSPEIYSIVNSVESAGQVVIFSHSPQKIELETEINPEKMLAVLNNKYDVKENKLLTPIHLKEEESSLAIFILPNTENRVSIISSTTNILSADFENGELKYTVESPGEQVIYWYKKNGKPTFDNSNYTKSNIVDSGERYEIYLQTKDSMQKVVVRGNSM